MQGIKSVRNFRPYIYTTVILPGEVNGSIYIATNTSIKNLSMHGKGKIPREEGFLVGGGGCSNFKENGARKAFGGSVLNEFSFRQASF